MEFTKLLEERRSIRAFAPEKHVTAEQIQEIVQAAIQAPSWKNSQTTRYYALVTPEKVEEFSAKCLPEFNQKSSKGAALVVTAFVKDRSGFTQDGTPDNEVGNGWGYYDLGLHDENLILRARELGLYTLIMGIRDEKAIREALSIPENELLGAVIAVGYRAINPDKPKRKTVDDILKLGKLLAERIDIAISDKTGNFLHRYAALEKNTGLLHSLPGAVPCRRDAGLFFKYFSKRLITDLE